MNRPWLAFLALLMAAPAQAAPGFYVETTLGSQDTVIVSAAPAPIVRFVFNRNLNPGPTTWPGGCIAYLTLQEAAAIGAAYQWVAAQPLPYAFWKTFELLNGGPYGASLTISRGPTGADIEATLDDGASPTSLWCTLVVMTNDEAFEIGGWLLEAVAP